MEEEILWWVGFEPLPIRAKNKQEAIKKIQEEIGITNPVSIDEDEVYSEPELYPK